MVKSTSRHLFYYRQLKLTITPDGICLHICSGQAGADWLFQGAWAIRQKETQNHIQATPPS